ncbi:MAG: cytidylate kinase [Candidatus Marinimicrobia bacterium]|nr:cytidylate kinase [Candidatus Neomarinimicrobiota bacterium]|tara:strand:+ start:2789 stop:3463 length:675 start_codon:yes stop_codon:yes gene_type:complete
MKDQIVPVITIDGPSGAGKGTIAQMLALDLEWNILDSGALYRTLAYFMLENGIALKDFNKKKDYIHKNFLVKFDPGIIGEPVKVIFNNKDITSKVRTEEIAKKTSDLAADPIIRDFIKPCQRDFKKPPGLIADGRDMGTVIFKDAEHKIFLTASSQERAKRRQTQLKRQGSEVNMRLLLQELEERDRKDTEREHSPLKPADSSIIIDTSNLEPEGVIKEIKKFI